MTAAILANHHPISTPPPTTYQKPLDSSTTRLPARRRRRAARRGTTAGNWLPAQRFASPLTGKSATPVARSHPKSCSGGRHQTWHIFFVRERLKPVHFRCLYIFFVWAHMTKVTGAAASEWLTRWALRPELFSLLVGVAVAAGAVVCVRALHRWQKGVMRREREDPPTGFPVNPHDEVRM